MVIVKVIDKFTGKYRFLSNFYPGDNNTLEHKYQASKTFHMLERASILSAATPGQAKRLGRRIHHLRSDWELVKVRIMKELLIEKFQDETLRKWLLDTGDAVLIEGNSWNDTFWGICNGQGENMLGRLLMEIRDNIRKEVEG